MKKSLIIAVISLQILTLGGVATTAYFTFMNKARIRATQRVMVETQDKLASTIAFMDEVAANKQKAKQANQPLAAGTAAPEFTLQDENENTVNVADFNGKKTLLVFSQQSCPYCKNFYPVLNEFQDKQDDVNVVVMQLDSTPEQNRAYKAEQGIKATMLAATVNELQNYKVQVTPTSVLLDENGMIVAAKNVSQLDELMAFVDTES